MKISHYFEWEDLITGGHSQSVENQRKIMDEKGIEYTTRPDMDADILHLNNMGPKSIYYAKRAKRKGIPVVIHAHQTAEDFRNSFAFSNILSKPMKPYLSYAYSLADLIICPSDHNKNVIESYSDAQKTVISNGFDPDKLDGFENLREEYLQKYDLTPPVVFMVGHVIRRKGLKSFIETAREMPEIDFVWFGYINPSGEEGIIDSMITQRETKKLIRSSPDNCQFTGYIEDIRGAFAAGDIFFFPTKNENEGMALLEAMHCGKAPLVRDIPTFDWLNDGENCMKAEDNFSEVLRDLTQDDMRQSLGKSAKNESKQFNIEKVGQSLIEAYENVLNAGKNS